MPNTVIITGNPTNFTFEYNSIVKDYAFNDLDMYYNSVDLDLLYFTHRENDEWQYTIDLTKDTIIVNGVMGFADASLLADALRMVIFQKAGNVTNGMPYNPNEPCVLANTQLRLGAWLVISNKYTCDYPIPVPIGDQFWQIIGQTFSTNQNTSVVYTGHEVTFNQGGWVTAIRVWIPELTANTNYRFLIIDITDPANPVTSIIEEGVLVEDDWTNIALGRSIVVPGQKFLMFIDALNSGANTTVTGGWTREDDSNNNLPSTGAWLQNNNNSILRINKIDLDSDDRTSELLGFVPNTTIVFAETASPANFREYVTNAAPVEFANHIEYDVTLTNTGGTLGTNITTTMTATIPVADPTQYVEQLNWWNANPSPVATITGFKQYDGVDQGVDPNTAYGIDFEFQRAEVSDDWDILAYSPELATT